MDLSHLSADKRQLVEAMLKEESATFSRFKGDIGDVPEIQMKINLKDHTPVQKRYNTVHRPLYPEVKAHLQDLLNRNIIAREYCSLMLVVITSVVCQIFGVTSVSSWLRNLMMKSRWWLD